MICVSTCVAGSKQRPARDTNLTTLQNLIPKLRQPQKMGETKRNGQNRFLVYPKERSKLIAVLLPRRCLAMKCPSGATEAPAVFELQGLGSEKDLPGIRCAHAANEPHTGRSNLLTNLLLRVAEASLQRRLKRRV